MKLWQKSYQLAEKIEKYTVGDDYILDQKLLKYDCRASIAHARMLRKIGIITEKEQKQLIETLEEIIKKGITIKPEDEDCHTAIENYLTAKLGVTGQKIHTARSRNDQVLTALCLYYKDQIEIIRNKIENLQESLAAFSAKYGAIAWPGYTHTRKAMPSSIGMWAAALNDSMADNRQQLDALLTLIDQSPAGSGAGYGLPLKIDREFIAAELGFARVQENPIYVQLSRGKFAGALLHLLSFIMFDVNRYAADLILFSMPEFGFLNLPDEFTTGSSIMPQKKNPDVLELMRANYHVVGSCELQVKSLCANLITGYHRDLQLHKRPTMQALEITIATLDITEQVFRNLEVDPERCRQGLSKELYATEKVYRLVQQGVPFREAYRRVAAEIE